VNEVAFRELISGEKQGAAPTLSRLGLRALSWPYGLVVWLRNRAFDAGLKRVHRVPVPVISVGNVTVGGTGKTPFVAHLVHWLSERGIQAALVSRGYRALPDETNDEKRLLKQLCPGVPHRQNPDRVAAARAVCREDGAKAIVLDDGFQHRRLGRDLDIVLIDALNPWGYDALLPRGLLREPVASLSRANVIVLTRVDQCSAEQRQQILARIHNLQPAAACVEVAYPPVRLVNVAGQRNELSSIAGEPVIAFCGIGNPDAFGQSLRDAGCNLKQLCPFPDHHHFQTGELDDLSRLAEETGAATVLTTQKDLVKIDRTELGGCPLWAVEIGAEIVTGADQLDRRLEKLFDN